MKLIRYISTRYSLYTILLTVLSVPLFYFLVQRIMMHNLDESMGYQKNWIRKKLEAGPPENVTSYNNSVVITPTQDKMIRDSFYSKDIFIPDDDEMVKHRILESVVRVNGTYYSIQIQKSMLEDTDLVQSISLLQVVFILLLLGGLFLINRNLSRKILKPFQDTLGKLADYRVDRYTTPRFEQTAIEEFEKLNRSLDALLLRNANLYKAQKEFTENAAHETQTPLAIIQSKLDLLLQTPVNGEQAGLIEELTLSVRKLQKLNRTLLLLTKIENNQFPETESIDVKTVVMHTANQFADIIAEKQIQLETGPLEICRIEANGPLIDILISNLFSNAFRHTGTAGAIRLSLLQHTFTISNTASGSALNAEQIFRRFQKQSTDSRSVGLGLEICKQICELYGYRLQYQFLEQRHYFSVSFS
ncbi:HAMP domain-containing histidine kinase [Niabella pedocola]|uniref:histidine kinase n=1 Tax=Niabella pedocola TaxID=1752077 RepID=A0ABS8PRJ8_9BACT|nr:HAMP domain-containing sensor histidine kinase [Niabella pedocola]MCD2423716.1 HAMP domain-containing histidine kinase [Niabella pedocola]